MPSSGYRRGALISRVYFVACNDIQHTHPGVVEYVKGFLAILPSHGQHCRLFPEQYNDHDSHGVLINHLEDHLRDYGYNPRHRRLPWGVTYIGWFPSRKLRRFQDITDSALYWPPRDCYKATGIAGLRIAWAVRAGILPPSAFTRYRRMIVKGFRTYAPRSEIRARQRVAEENARRDAIWAAYYAREAARETEEREEREREELAAAAGVTESPGDAAMVHELGAEGMVTAVAPPPA
ncbi:hypothetical protein QBC39DRAFT_330247 [Podospora conica]|nr:hypothetical protein QBC39DRAFT_330247 [Schizothecium conicum]